MKITIFLPICRENRVKEMIRQVNELEVNDHDINVLSVIDNIRIKTFKTKYPTRCVYTGENGPTEANVGQRRKRIANVFNKAKNYIRDDIDLIFTIEDDSEIRPNALSNLLNLYFSFNNNPIGLVSGVQVGRWGFKMMGIWYTDNPDSPHRMYTMSFDKNDFEYPNNLLLITEIHAAGFYCFITPRELFVNHEFRGDRFFGPDVYYGLELRKQGYSNYLDTSVVVGHVVNNGRVLLPDEDVVQLEYKKINNVWQRVKP